MSKVLKNAINEAREFYIHKLIAEGYFLDQGLLSSYTLSELKKEYTTLITKGRDQGGSKATNRLAEIGDRHHQIGL
ncbi:hypothetical protein AB685_01855 [Bacillus sp. LL01]|uniref:Fur-regulated basic protein FbpA n=1 Tax=Bacillus sp. LL01 TaxID=1665556 RepID=UPI00064D0981|nr:Fur-regulated basic protein FbpA [Bacillus sp. LL01]KMJ59642.1 hypothetical protein AB685_01855 [Bacillus sp. LL01]